jgi:hypothetical protein
MELAEKKNKNSYSVERNAVVYGIPDFFLIISDIRHVDEMYFLRWNRYDFNSGLNAAFSNWFSVSLSHFFYFLTKSLCWHMQWRIHTMKCVTIFVYELKLVAFMDICKSKDIAYTKIAQYKSIKRPQSGCEFNFIKFTIKCTFDEA